MTTYIKVLINDVEIETDMCNVSKSLGDINSTSNFTITINNYKGESSDSYEIGDEVKIYVDKDVNPPTTQIFLGILENIKLAGRELSETLTLTGRDYSARLIDRTVEPEVYNDETAGDIVKDIIAKYTDDITTNNVADGVTISRILFNQKPVFDAIIELAKQSGFIFYIDNDKDLHFEEGGLASSGKTFNGTNITKAAFDEKRDTVYNEVWVYGDRYLDGYEETQQADGTGSVFTMTYKPNSPIVQIGSSASDSMIIQPGGIYQMTYTAGSRTKYLVNYEDQQIIFVSGTQQGDNIPAAGSDVIVNYFRDLPIVKVGENDNSIAKYGKRVKVIQDTNIKDPLTAEALMLQTLDDNSDPVKEGTLFIQGVVNVTPGETCVVDIPIYGINSVTYKMIEVRYTINKKTQLSDEVLQIRLNKKIEDITDTLKNILLQLNQIQGQNISSTDLLTRYKQTTGSFGIRQSGLAVYVRNIAGLNIVCNSPVFGLLGVYEVASSSGIQTSFVLSQNPQGILGTSTLGQNFSEYQMAWSGGYF